MITSDFFKTLYQFCDEGKINIRPIPGTNSFVDVDDYEGIETLCDEKTNYYFGVALRNNDGTKAGITEIPALHCDVDYKETPRAVLVEKLKQFPFKPSIIVKSGGGVHFYFILKEPSDKHDIPIVEDVNRRIAVALGGDLNACDASRIMRIPGTMNVKYNPPVLCEMVKKEDYYYGLDDFLEVLSEVIKNEAAKVKDNNWVIEAMQGVNDGERGATAAKIAGYWINKVSPSDVLAILQTWNQNNNPPLSDSAIHTTVKSISRYEPQKQRQVDLSNIYDSKRMVEAYKEYVKSLKNNRFITGINEIDKRIRGVAGGEVLTIIARAGSFKTATLQNMLKNYIDHSSWAAVFFSLEMPVASLTERYFGILDGCGGREVEKMFSEPDQYNIMTASIAQFEKNLERLYIIPSKISTSDIPKYINIIQTEYNVKVGVIGIDYLGLIDAHGSSEYETVSKVARNIKQTAKLLNLPIVLLSQVNRKGGDGQSEISLEMGRGSGAIEEAADFVLGLWQIGEKEDRELVCRILKNRKGAPGSRWRLSMYPNTLCLSSESEKYEPPQKHKNGYPG
jgi:hypothetical protein